ncbi:hypothetical protein EUX98_g4069 [Antrodiella citrinella]|uniref:ubiquitinyl hydrolase 1 n=1 Tax=Antrodiella citrinella TaxID=2447956 RepID=A0A4S4MV27_9APHY|nr:hypothetical protein EUX98_g4069 [Antrodiella citrinella]
MAALQHLTSLIYHEKQEQGSMLCAQHALNGLLQENYYTAPDLSHIAHELDQLEEQYDDHNSGATSTNMDDTGFFSLQVLEKALQYIRLVRWRSEAMRPYTDHPETQLAFILNYQQHWYTLRRFGAASSDPSLASNPEEGIWFNLNSSLPQPERIGSTHLGMVLQQAEAEGYSVFAVVQLDPEGPLALRRTEVDEYAATLGSASGAGFARPDADDAMQHSGLEDEDMDMQAALQASLMMDAGSGRGGSGSGSGDIYGSSSSNARYPPPISANPFSNPLGSRDTNTNSGLRTPTQRTRSGYSALSHQSSADSDEDDEYVDAEDSLPALGTYASASVSDPLAASRRRSELLIAHMQRQQEAAMRETHMEEAMRVQAGMQPRRRRTQHEEEQAELERAIAANEDDDGEGEGEERIVPGPVVQEPVGLRQTSRVYDDDDAELQAALKASLESVPPGFQVPDTPPPRRFTLPPPPAPSIPPPPPAVRTASSDSMATDDDETESEADSSVVEEPAPVVDVDEMRRRRLAKFGA